VKQTNENFSKYQSLVIPALESSPHVLSGTWTGLGPSLRGDDGNIMFNRQFNKSSPIGNTSTGAAFVALMAGTARQYLSF